MTWQGNADFAPYFPDQSQSYKERLLGTPKKHSKHHLGQDPSMSRSGPTLHCKERQARTAEGASSQFSSLKNSSIAPLWNLEKAHLATTHNFVVAAAAVRTV